MKTHHQPIPLNPATAAGESRLVKTAALFTFRGLRAIVEAARTVPGIVVEAASDIREAASLQDATHHERKVLAPTGTCGRKEGVGPGLADDLLDALGQLRIAVRRLRLSHQPDLEFAPIHVRCGS